MNLMLVITHPAKDEYAVIERVLSDVDNAKAQCFKKSYSGIKTRVPPFVPFVLQLQMSKRVKLEVKEKHNGHRNRTPLPRRQCAMARLG